MSSQRMSLVFFIFFIPSILLTPTESVCTYSANLNAALSSLPTNVNSNGFYSASVGQNPDIANAIALCRGDTQLHTCRECLRNITVGLVELCPYHKQAIGLYEFCMLRYSNETIFGILETSPAVWWWNTDNDTIPDWFESDLSWLLDSLRNRAASGGSLRKVPAGNATAVRKIYSLLQCTPDLSAEDCDSCLMGAIADIPRCCVRKRGDRVNRPSCTLRFKIYRFYNRMR